MIPGILYGVGVGPGAPDLLTLRAARVLREVPVLALPRASAYGKSTAWEIVRTALAENAEQERLFLTFPMSRDPARVKPAVLEASRAVAERLERGLSVAFATEGDPSLFSTFTYLRDELTRRLPSLRVQVVPGVSSITAAPAEAGFALADGQERIAIVPAAYGIDDLEAVLERFDTTILMKLGPELPNIVKLLERRAWLDRAVYVSRASMRDQRIERDVRQVEAERGDCFAMLIVAKKERNLLLVGGAEPGASRALEETG